jgi:hypothetical protein
MPLAFAAAFHFASTLMEIRLVIRHEKQVTAEFSPKTPRGGASREVKRANEAGKLGTRSTAEYCKTLRCPGRRREERIEIATKQSENDRVHRGSKPSGQRLQSCRLHVDLRKLLGRGLRNKNLTNGVRRPLINGGASFCRTSERQVSSSLIEIQNRLA